LKQIIKENLSTRNKESPRYYANLGPKNLRKHLTKRKEANIWKFSDKKERGDRSREETLRRLVEVIGSSKKMERLEIDYTLWGEVWAMFLQKTEIKDCYQGPIMLSLMREKLKRLRSLETLKLIFHE